MLLPQARAGQASPACTISLSAGVRQDLRCAPTACGTVPEPARTPSTGCAVATGRRLLEADDALLADICARGWVQGLPTARKVAAPAQAADGAATRAAPCSRGRSAAKLCFARTTRRMRSRPWRPPTHCSWSAERRCTTGCALPGSSSPARPTRAAAQALRAQGGGATLAVAATAGAHLELVQAQPRLGNLDAVLQARVRAWPRAAPCASAH